VLSIIIEYIIELTHCRNSCIIVYDLNLFCRVGASGFNADEEMARILSAVYASSTTIPITPSKSYQISTCFHPVL